MTAHTTLAEILGPAATRPLRDVRPTDYLRSCPDSTLWTLNKLWADLRADGYAMRLILGPGDLLKREDRDSTSFERYRTGTICALYLASQVVMEMSDGRRWVHKSMNGPSGCFEEADMDKELGTDNQAGMSETTHTLFKRGGLAVRVNQESDVFGIEIEGDIQGQNAVLVSEGDCSARTRNTFTRDDLSMIGRRLIEMAEQAK